jgi:hypothetical protein
LKWTPLGSSVFKGRMRISFRKDPDGKIYIVPQSQRVGFNLKAANPIEFVMRAGEIVSGLQFVKLLIASEIAIPQAAEKAATEIPDRYGFHFTNVRWSDDGLNLEIEAKATDDAEMKP